MAFVPPSRDNRVRMPVRQSPTDLLADAEGRWLRIADDRPELAAAVDLQRVLVTRGAEVATDAERLTRGASAAPPDLAERLAREDAPVLDLAIDDLDVERLTTALLGFCDDFAAGGAGDPARRVRAALECGDIETGSLLRASLARQQTAIRMRAQHLGVAPDLVWLVAELTVGPIAHYLQEQALGPPAAVEVRAAAAGWRHGHCPACGSWPALAEVRAGKRHLRCSFCGADWAPAPTACVYCGRADDGYLVAAAQTATDPERARRVEFCRGCGGWLKQVDVTDATPFVLLPVLDLETCDLDASAAGRGYVRPPMRDLPTRNLPCPPPEEETVR